MLDMPMHILNQAVGFYLMHAWIWPRTAGMVSDWNPDVICPDRGDDWALRDALEPLDPRSADVRSHSGVGVDG